jgi:hypothetical protein
MAGRTLHVIHKTKLYVYFVYLKSIFTVKPSIKTAFIKNNHLSNILQAMG